jgi:hypothetical protein
VSCFRLASGLHACTVDTPLAMGAVVVARACFDATALIATCPAEAFAVELTRPAVIGDALLAPGAFALVVAVARDRGTATAGARAARAAVPIVPALLTLPVDTELLALAVGVRIAGRILDLATGDRMLEGPDTVSWPPICRCSRYRPRPDEPLRDPAGCHSASCDILPRPDRLRSTLASSPLLLELAVY